jgi:hypothetical protein
LSSTSYWINAAHIVTLVRKARHYFPKGSTKEIVEFFAPLLCPSDASYDRAMVRLFVCLLVCVHNALFPLSSFLLILLLLW